MCELDAHDVHPTSAPCVHTETLSGHMQQVFFFLPNESWPSFLLFFSPSSLTSIAGNK